MIMERPQIAHCCHWGYFGELAVSANSGQSKYSGESLALPLFADVQEQLVIYTPST
jgi:hypothetical protein